MSKNVRIVVFGDRSVGKTALTTCFVSNHFVEEYHPTVEEDTYSLIDRTDPSRIIKFDIIDTSGMEMYKKSQDVWVRDANAFVLVYSVASRDSFVRMFGTLGSLDRRGRTSAPVVVVGNKCDLAHQREVTRIEGCTFGKQFCNGIFVEASAKCMLNVQVIFQHLMRCIRTKLKEEEAMTAKRKKKSRMSF